MRLSELIKGSKAARNDAPNVVCNHCGAVWDERHDAGECGVANATARILENYTPRTPREDI